MVDSYILQEKLYHDFIDLIRSVERVQSRTQNYTITHKTLPTTYAIFDGNIS